MSVQTEYKERIRRNLVTYMAAKGVTKAQLARHCGVSSPTVTNWVNGRNSIDVNHLFTIANYLGVSVDELGGRTTPSLSAEEKDLIVTLRDNKSVDTKTVTNIVVELGRGNGGRIKVKARPTSSSLSDRQRRRKKRPLTLDEVRAAKQARHRLSRYSV